MTDKTLGAYQRHEKHDAADFARAEFARAPVGDATARRTPLGYWTGPAFHGIDDEAMARGGWVPVRECPDPDDHILARDYAAMSDRATAWQKRAEEAEKDLAGARMAGRLALQQRDSERERADVAEEQLAAVSRPLTPDAITDEMAERAEEALYDMAAVGVPPTTMRAVLTAALTEPPARPEGAEEIEGLITYHYDDMPAETLTALSDALAERYTPIEGGAR